MDHVWQIGHLGPPEHEMLEAYTTLGWLAARTERVKLLTVVTAVVYRDPGLLAKAVTTLDVLSGGRAMLGIGAAGNCASEGRAYDEIEKTVMTYLISVKTGRMSSRSSSTSTSWPSSASRSPTAASRV